MRVIVTRARPEAERWSLELSARGLEAVALPLIQLDPVDDPAELMQAWQHLRDYAGVMFVSAKAVEAFFLAQPTQSDEFKPQAGIKTRAWATGPGTAKALLRAGVAAELIDAPSAAAGQFDSEALWQVVAGQVRPGTRVLIVRGSDAPVEVRTDVAAVAAAQRVRGSSQAKVKAQGNGRDWFANQVRQHGAQVDFVVAYQRGAPTWSPAQFEVARQAASDGSIWLFSSTQALANLDAVLPGQDWAGAFALATHPRIALAAKTAGFGVVWESRPILDDVVAILKRPANALKSHHEFRVQP